MIIQEFAIGSARWITAFLWLGMASWTVQAATTNNIWRTGGKVYSSPAIGSDGTIYVGSYDGNLYAFALNGQTSHVWATGGAIQSSPAIGDDDTLYVGSMDSNFYAFAPDGTTSHVWRTGGSIISSPAIGTNGNIYVGSMDWNLYEFLPNGTTGHIWQTQDYIESSPALNSVGSNTYIYVASYDGSVYQFLPDGSTGKIWGTESWIQASPVIHSNGNIYVGSLDDGLYECDPSSDLPAISIWPGNIASSVAILEDGNLCFGTQGGYFEIITTGGVEVDRFFLGGEINSSPAIGSDGTIYVGNSYGILYAVSGSSSTALVQTAGSVNSSPAVWGGLIYVGSDDGNCYSIDDGLTNAVAYTAWPKFRHHNRNIGRSLELEKGLAPVNGYLLSTPAIGTNRNVYVGSSEGVIYAIAQDGSIRHTWHTAGAITSSVAIGTNGCIYVGSCDSNLYEFLPNGTTGHIWTAGDQIWTTPAIGSNGVLYVGACDSKFYAFALDGTTNHIWNVDKKIDYSSAAIARNGTIYVGCYDGNLYGFNPDGTTSHVWSTHANIRAPPAIDVDGTIYVGSMDDCFYSFNPDGTTNWFNNVNANIRAGAVIDANGTIFVGADLYVTNGIVNPGCVYAFGRDGSTKYVWHVDGEVRTSPAIGFDGTVYILSDSGYLWAFASEENPRRAHLPIRSFGDYSSLAISPDQTILFTSGTNLCRFNSTGGKLATAPWPKFHYETRNSGWATSSVPDQPTGLNASDGAYTDRVDLVWNEPAYAVGYQIYRSTNGISPTNASLCAVSSTTNYTDSSAEPGKLYYYWVRATNILGASVFSASDTGYRLFPSPTITATDGTYTDRVSLTWTNIQNATNYSIYRSTNDNPTGVAVLAISAANCYDDMQAEPGVLYYYWAKATNALCGSTWSASDSGYRRLATPLISASDGVYTDRVEVIWSTISNATAYFVFRNTNSSPAGLSLLTTSITTNYADTSVAPSILYYYWVMASNAVCTSAWSASDSGYLNLSAASLTASDGNYTDKVRLLWTSVSGATGYQLYRNTNDDISGVTAFMTSTALSYDDTNALTGVIYYYWVRATNTLGLGLLSPSDTGCRALLTTPTGLAASDGTYTDKIHLIWQAVADATNYQIFRNTIASTNSLVVFATSATTTFDDTNAVQGALYYYWVNAIGTNGAFGLFSPSDTGYILVASPSVLTATDGEYIDKVRVSWTASTNAVNYRVWRNTSGAFSSATVLSDTSQTTLDDTTVGQNVLYYYWVAAMNALGISANSGSDTGYRQLTTPTGLVATHGTDVGKVIIIWQSVEGATSYTVWRNALNNTNSATQLGETTQLSCDDSSAQPNIKYYYWIKAKNNVTISTFSASVLGWRKSLASTPNGGIDFNGDGAGDVTVFNRSSAMWYSYIASSGEVLTRQFGSAGDCPNSGDFDGDGKADLGVYSDSGRYWKIRTSSDNIGINVTIGGSGSVPLSGDFDGDGITDWAVYQESSGIWSVITLHGLAWTYYTLTFGGVGYAPVKGDFDGDSKLDPAVFHTASGNWFILLSAGGYSSVTFSFGGPGFIPVCGDFDGDNKSDPGIYQEATGVWGVLLSESSYDLISGALGGPGWVPVNGDFDGDNLSDYIVYQETTGLWCGCLSSTGYSVISFAFGGPGYRAVGTMP